MMDVMLLLPMTSDFAIVCLLARAKLEAHYREEKEERGGH